MLSILLKNIPINLSYEHDFLHDFAIENLCVDFKMTWRFL